MRKYNKAIIIDCHSFSDVPFKTDPDKTANRPDICLGIDEFHTPDNLIDFIMNKFTDLHYSVKINSPYSGTLIPLGYYKKNTNVMGIMIEINRKIYLNDNREITMENVSKLNKMMNDIFNDQ